MSASDNQARPLPPNVHDFHFWMLDEALPSKEPSQRLFLGNLPLIIDASTAACTQLLGLGLLGLAWFGNTPVLARVIHIAIPLHI